MNIFCEEPPCYWVDNARKPEKNRYFAKFYAFPSYLKLFSDILGEIFHISRFFMLFWVFCSFLRLFDAVFRLILRDFAKSGNFTLFYVIDQVTCGLFALGLS